MSGFFIRQLTADDWQTFRNIRLESLALHPEFFAPSQDETKYTSDQWIERLANKNAASFGLFYNDKIIGVTAIARENNASLSDRAMMMASYIKHEFRGMHLSKLFYEARIDWAKKQKNIKILLISHRRDNLISKNANQRFGFKFTDSYRKTYLDGVEDSSLVYELNIVD